MDKTNTTSEKLFIAFGVITILSGIGLIISNKYLIGISGTFVGIWLIAMNWKQLRDKG